MKSVIPTALGVKKPSAARESVFFFRGTLTGSGAGRRGGEAMVAVKVMPFSSGSGFGRNSGRYLAPLSWTFLRASSGEILSV
ncbi:hypothetical protein NtRootA4_39480 [Arthrobacter sp. NtRootA4]|nr:hypothetical protein NtRootA2_00600 [Arthrobacter sp. NtRootA2]BCW16969.1 hypothetical protein NtRootA4_39480 [Arthrobacter sp. NtRootA4]BCW21193.1 hypothetical protein NtRootC7_00600 [Arthrobacter sp. NtRootC7]BCW25460.1 hypothetical protein NtRootC45_00600 [Arthrobacter sp. NtRootC45]BCW29729.1 hypothetical protein NtRootD5_00600 [Arthrobacter sp. NtRootD5]